MTEQRTAAGWTLYEVEDASFLKCDPTPVNVTLSCDACNVTKSFPAYGIGEHQYVDTYARSPDCCSLVTPAVRVSSAEAAARSVRLVVVREAALRCYAAAVPLTYLVRAEGGGGGGEPRQLAANMTGPVEDVVEVPGLAPRTTYTLALAARPSLAPGQQLTSSLQLITVTTLSDGHYLLPSVKHIKMYQYFHFST